MRLGEHQAPIYARDKTGKIIQQDGEKRTDRTEYLEHPTTRWWAQNYFLELLDKKYPAVKVSLINSAFPVYQECSISEDMHSWESLMHVNPEYYHYLLPLKNAMLNWSRSFLWRDVWMLNKALDTMRYWAETPESYHKYRWQNGSLCLYEPDIKVLLNPDEEDEELRWEVDIDNIPFAPYRPRFETEAQFIERCKNHAKFVNQALAEGGSKKTPLKKELEHFNWVLWNFVGKITQSAIAEKINRHDDNAVRKAIRETKLMIGLGQKG